MKFLVSIFGVALLLFAVGCAVESGYGGYGGSVYGEYPSAYYPTTTYAGTYVYPYHHHSYAAPYDRDHYWDRYHYWDQHRYPYWH